MQNNKSQPQPTVNNTIIPTRNIGPVLIHGEGLNNALVKVPLATYETTLWPSTDRGAKISRLAGGIHCLITDEKMTRSIVIQAANATQAMQAKQKMLSESASINHVITSSSNYAQLQQLHIEQIADLLYIRIECSTGNASGHNMTTKAADAVINWLAENLPELKYVSISANTCTDKKNSAINGILGRGKRVIAEINISSQILTKYLRTSAQKIVDLHIKKNLLGSILAGSVRSANAHFSNVLLAIYLATGQDAANIVEGSQGITHAEARGDNLYFSITLPNIIVGTVGNGKQLAHVQQNLRQLKCSADDFDATATASAASRRLAAIIGASVLCSELSLLAAQTNPGELMRAHQLHERKQKHKEPA